MNVIKSFYIFLFICLSFSLRAQRAPIVNESLLTQLENSIKSGQKRSLRDLGSLLDKPKEKKQAQEILQRYTMFTEDELDLSTSVSKSKFLKFYYTNESEIKFSELTGNYYLRDLEDRPIKTNIKTIDAVSSEVTLGLFHKVEESINKAIEANQEDDLIAGIKQLRTLEIDESQEFLISLTQQLRSNKEKNWSPKLYQCVNESLVYAIDVRSMRAILNLLSESRIETKDALQSLAMLSNIALPEKTKKRVLLQKYKFYIDSLSTMESIRMYGYEQIFNFRPSFFENIVDYFGRVLCFANEREWLVHNAVHDLIRTTHPRALFYLSALGFKNEYHYPAIPFNFEESIDNIQKLTHIKLKVADKDGNTVVPKSNSDRQTKLNYLVYWATKYNDYEWDASRDKFVNKHQALEKTQHYERLFRRLNSRNDSVAMASFKQLTEGDPGEIVSLANKYRQMFRSYNQTLPPFKYKYLEQLAELTIFCRKHDINYEPNGKLKKLLGQLGRVSNQPERYSLENKIIKNLTINDITPLEYWACIHQENSDNNFSVGRILDIFYSKHWNKVLSDDLQLRLFLKKADLFKGIGVIGVCNTYLNKFDLQQEGLKKQLQNIQKEETDEHILNQIAQLIQFNETEENNAFSDFIASPMYFDKRDIKVLPSPNLEDLNGIISMIQKEQENGIIGKLFFYLRLHPNIESVPSLMELAANDRIIAKKRGKVVTLGDQVTPILESIFSYNYPMTADDKIFDIRPWLKKWKKDKANYQNWPKEFFEEKMTFLEEQKELTIEDINLITESPNYEISYKDFCLKALQKVKPVKSIRSLSMEPKLSIKTDLHYFETFEFSYKQLDDIPKLFEMDDPKTMLNFLIKRADLYDVEKKGSFYNNMFRNAWFSNYLNSGSADLVAVAYIQSILQTYLDDSEYMSEYEEQITTLHLAQLQNIGKPLEERLLAPFDLNADIAAKAKIQETIISTISYDQIGIIAKHFNDLTATLGEQPWSFLYRDFGIPIFDLSSEESYVSFRRNLNNMTESELYFHYLKEFGIDFTKKNNKLDFEKIANILRFDTVTPFVGGGGGKRDYHTYGIIKLLELHFNTRLDFHEKLNENQSFYTFSTSKRSKAWINYLLEQNLILIPEDEAPSFNKLVE